MSAPTPYVRRANFENYATNQQGENPNVLPNNGGELLDQEFDEVRSSLNGAIANLNLIQRSDGALKNGVVTTDSLSTQVMALMTSQTWTARGYWVTTTEYELGELVQDGAGGSTYVCCFAHLSGSFSTDVSDGKWMFVGIGNLSGISGTLPVAHGGTGQTTAAAALDAISQSTLSVNPGNQSLGIGTSGNQPIATLQIYKTAFPAILLSDATTGYNAGCPIQLASNTSPTRTELWFGNGITGSENGFQWLANSGYRARLTGDGLFGLGNFNGITPSSIIHAKKSTDVECAVQTTNSTYVNGLKVGIAPGGVGFIKQVENKNLTLWTNNTQRLVLDILGNMALGNDTPMSAPNYNFITLGSGSSRGGVDLQGPSGQNARFQLGDARLSFGPINNDRIAFQTNNVERMSLSGTAAVLYIGGTSRTDSAGEVAAKNTAKAWCTFNGATTGTNAPTAGFNVTSITRNGTGDYTVTFTNALTDANFSVAGVAIKTSGGGVYCVSSYGTSNGFAKTTTTLRFGVRKASTDAVTDVEEVSIQIFGN